MKHCKCPLCDSSKGVRHLCEVCQQQFCRHCCKHFISLQDKPGEQVRACDKCYLQHVSWDPTRSYDVFGSEGDKTVVLVHGALVGRQNLVLEAKALAQVGFRVVVPDLPAHGSRFRETPLTLDNAIGTLHDVIQKEAGGQKVVMMGFSMGGYIAAAFAARYPHLLAGVLLGGCCHDMHNIKSQLMGRIAAALCRMRSYRTRSQLLLKGSREQLHPERTEIQECFLRAGAEVDSLQYAWKVMYEADMRQLLLKITCPALLVVGEHEYRDHEHKWLSKLQHGGLLVLKGGSEQFMFQPEVGHDFRMNTEGFAAAADWGPPPGRRSQSGSSCSRASTELTAQAGNSSSSAGQEEGEVQVQVNLIAAAASGLKGASRQCRPACPEAQHRSAPGDWGAARAARRITAPALGRHSLGSAPGAAAVGSAAGRAGRRLTSPGLGRLSGGAGGAGVSGSRDGCGTAPPALGKSSFGISTVVVNALSLLRPNHKKDLEPFSAASSPSYDNMYRTLRRHSVGT